MICTDYNLIFPHSSRWEAWLKFETEISQAESLEPYLQVKRYEDLEPYFFRKANYEMDESEAYSDYTAKQVVSYEDTCMRKSILYRAMRRQLINGAEPIDSDRIERLFEKETAAYCEAYECTEFPPPSDTYEEWESWIYTHVQYLIEGKFGEECRDVLKNMVTPTAAAYNNWAYDLLKTNRPEEALDILNRALKLDFECVYVWDTLSLVYEKLSMPDKVEWARKEANKPRDVENKEVGA